MSFIVSFIAICLVGAALIEGEAYIQRRRSAEVRA